MADKEHKHDTADHNRLSATYVYTHLHAGLAEVKVQASNLGVLHALGHLLRGDCAVEGIAINQPRLLGAAAMSLEDVDSLDGIASFALRTEREG
jgi:hypothetical protein